MKFGMDPEYFSLFSMVFFIFILTQTIFKLCQHVRDRQSKGDEHMRTRGSVKVGAETILGNAL